MISVDNVTVLHGGTALFSNISFAINENDKIALMGKNGAGKSTLLKIIAGQSKPTSGAVSAPKGYVVAYLPQHLLTSDDCTVMDETAKAFASYLDMKAEIERINEELTVRTDYESEEYYKLIEQVSELSEKFYAIEEVNYEAEVEKVLLGLGFERDDLQRSTSEFSGGWRMRIELAKILLQKPDLILLDEPTNHLDIESIQWLEEFLISKAKAVVVISHDRAFVDNITTRTIEVTMGRIYDYKAKYSHYLELRKERREQQQKHYEEQQKFIAETTQFIERFKGTYSKTLQVQSRVKMLEKLELVEVDEVDTSALKLRFPPSPRSGKYPVIVDEMSKSYGDHVVFKDASMTIEQGQKVAFVGKNGEGKSTMIKAIMGEIDYEGKCELGHNALIGYFAQNQASLLDESLTIFETIDQIAVGEIRTKIKDLLGAFMFKGDDINKKVKVLSGGEKTRLAMIKLLLEPVNLLILDEPTNHLDMKTKDIIKDALKAFDGTLVVVSHDRDFLDGLVTKVFEFGNKRVKEHFEDINGFLRNKKMENLREVER
ncbi:MAG TPA: glycosyl transferase family 2 [Algoriphagus sp.]|jgi:ATP-binding cassette subfamily F protein 3|uniref:ABC-F family ATP-binding cassette domain-containing protein n=2 Tax=Algoriphagus TaxID=246875 RepID=UPI000C6AD9E6|nr:MULTISPECIES: ABC-F family ATP-binding cassette domain-containing protein [unclassified Algoriphagus]MAL13856.1 glycosyl transferase family 2 [Algoriphagus sp.]MAN87544.1 glycosyl transferase family 2 [Algoriphagus sp.]QYH37703.1 ABC-F family ATP-binding cassette domain-containing protein [Algoriphagus sp. NBT04N3]HAD51474.1 glycosyl transferase family 2 [Algoriphagus sp.]HCD87283.1 glycosyl transferase family 2 [Algoriphagus sp.]|tara:strand:- start:447 stop:2078 length:1632 start_codon:yes stop_codon:yes gene_type:complete